MAVSSATAPVVGVDLGGTKILAAVVGPDNKILGRAKRPTPAEAGGSAILSAIVACFDQALAESGVDRNDVAAIGIGSPGPIDHGTGTIPFSANLNVRDWALGPDLSRATGRPVLLQNDVRVGSYGEFRLGAGRGYSNVLTAFIGTGIGGCIIIDGKIFEGTTGNAGEIGHVIVKANGPKCGCGRRGCLEALSSRTAIARRIGKAVRKGIETVLASKVDKKSGRIKSGDLAAALASGDAVAVAEVHRAAHFLGLCLGGLANLLGPELIIVGGGVLEALGPLFLDQVRQAADGQILIDPQRTIKIEQAALGDDSGILGAALLARERHLA